MFNLGAYDNAIDRLLDTTMDRVKDKTVYIGVFKEITEKIDECFNKGQNYNAMRMLHLLTDIVDSFTSLDCASKATGKKLNIEWKHNELGRYIETILTFY